MDKKLNVHRSFKDMLNVHRLLPILINKKLPTQIKTKKQKLIVLNIKSFELHDEINKLQ